MPCEFEDVRECKQFYIVHKKICPECKRATGDILLDRLVEALGSRSQDFPRALENAQKYLALVKRCEIIGGELYFQPSMVEFDEMSAKTPEATQNG